MEISVKFIKELLFKSWMAKTVSQQSMASGSDYCKRDLLVGRRCRVLGIDLDHALSSFALVCFSGKVSSF
jgi:hypothetical protein